MLEHWFPERNADNTGLQEMHHRLSQVPLLEQIRAQALARVVAGLFGAK